MALFSWRKDAPPRVDSAEDRVTTLSRRVDELEGEARKLRSEWYDTLDKLNRQAQRIAKRHERELAAIAPDDPTPQVNGGDEVDRILRLRRGNRGG